MLPMKKRKLFTTSMEENKEKEEKKTEEKSKEKDTETNHKTDGEVIKKKRGRPPKISEDDAKKPRGRPKKVQKVDNEEKSKHSWLILLNYFGIFLKKHLIMKKKY